TMLAEIEPPKGVNVSGMVGNAKKVKEGIDAFVVPEMSNAVMRMSSLGGALVLRNEGLPAALQVCCRDRNRLAIQGDLLAAQALGISAVMAVSGQDPSFGDHHQTRSVYDIDLIELIKVIGRLNQGRDMAGIELDGSPDFLIGSTTEAGAKGKSTEMEVDEIMKRVEAGARFLITSPVFDIRLLEPFRKRLDLQKVTLIPTVMLLKSLGMVRYITSNLPHIHIPEEISDRLAGAPDKVRECIQIAAELIKEIRDQGFGGVYLATLGWEHRLSDIRELV
ncbi:MAG: methylenetetrahydrofolate reductase, partial [Thermodesulfobacteriota bacterium]